MRISEDLISTYSIRLQKEIGKRVHRMMEVLQNACPDKLHPPTDGRFSVKLPSKFRERRALAIACWYFPNEILKWEVVLQFLQEQNFSHIRYNWVQEIELQVLIRNEEIALKYIEEKYNPRVLFGTILQEDLLNALFSLEVHLEGNRKPRSLVRRKGYRDKGTYRPPHRWEPRFDYLLTEDQNRKERNRIILKLLHVLILVKLESL